MAGIDHTTAEIALRERFAFTAQKAAAAMAACRESGETEGNVLLSTCNRTEWYFSCKDGAEPDPAALFCRFAGALLPGDAASLTVREGEAAARHLMEVAAGLHSRILGEDQVVSQVRAAAELAREARASDAALETLFRLAVTAGKQVKTEVRLRAVPASAARSAAELLEKRFGDLRGVPALVIGNGEMGRLAASLLREKGCRVTITLRTYRHGESVVPEGCRAVPYDERLRAIENARVVLSATTSPHYTVTAEMLKSASRLPECIVDLALPRDVEPAVAGLGIRCEDIDSVAGEELRTADEGALEKCRALVGRQMERFGSYLNMQACLPVIGEIKKLALCKITDSLASQPPEGQGRRAPVAFTVDKTVDMLLFSMKETLTPEALALVRERVRGVRG